MGTKSAGPFFPSEQEETYFNTISRNDSSQFRSLSNSSRYLVVGNCASVDCLYALQSVPSWASTTVVHSLTFPNVVESTFTSPLIFLRISTDASSFNLEN